MYMRYILYIFTIGLIFTAGMMVGHFYVPAKNTSLAAAVSVPDLDRLNPALDLATLEQAQRNISALTQALSSCPVVVEAERDRLFKELSLFFSLQDFELKKAVYEAEIAKNTVNSRPTSQFLQAAEQYATAKKQTEQLADELFPMPAPQPTQPSTATVQEAVQTETAATEPTAPSSATASGGLGKDTAKTAPATTK